MILQIILWALFGLIAFLLLAAVLMKKESSLSVSVTINKPQAEVFNFIKHLKNQENYSKWVMADPNVKINYTGTDGTVGFKAAWSSNDKNVGVGEQEIIDIMKGIGYKVEIRFEKPFKGISYATNTTKAIDENNTKLTTVFDFNTPFPMNVLVPLTSKMLLKDMNENANNLKKLLES
jgi:hypothetical protein